jgi:tetratricopeptide (TPR) repeat protein
VTCLRAEAAERRRNGDWAGVARACEAIVASEPESWGDAMLWAEALLRLGRRLPARALLEVMEDAVPGDVTVLLTLARLDLAEGRVADALRRSARALDGAPADPDVLALRAEAHVRAAGSRSPRRLDAAERLARVEAEIARGAQARVAEAADLALRLGDMGTAEHWLGQVRAGAEQAGPRERHDAARRCAEFLWTCGRWQEALPYYLEAELHIARSGPARLDSAA